MLEGYTGPGFVAGQTRRMTLGPLVTGLMYCRPGLLAKIMTMLDVLSGGRGRLGIGASWYGREQAGRGVPVVPVAERFERLEESRQIRLQMWRDDDGPYRGRHYQLAETLCVPPPLRQPPLADVPAFLTDLEAYAVLRVTDVQSVPDRHPVEFVEQIADRILPRAATIGA